MSRSVQLSDQLYEEARRYAAASRRSIPQQIEYWARMGKIADDNPDLPCGFIKEILLSKQDAHAGKMTEYKFG